MYTPISRNIRKTNIIIYQSKNNKNISVDVLYDNEDFWLTQKSMSKLFNVEVNIINYHLKEVLLDSNSNIIKDFQEIVELQI